MPPAVDDQCVRRVREAGAGCLRCADRLRGRDRLGRDLRRGSGNGLAAGGSGTGVGARAGARTGGRRDRCGAGQEGRGRRGRGGVGTETSGATGGSQGQSGAGGRRSGLLRCDGSGSRRGLRIERGLRIGDDLGERLLHRLALRHERLRDVRLRGCTAPGWRWAAPRRSRRPAASADRSGGGERLALGRDAERAGGELLRGLERHARAGADAVALPPHVLGEVGAQLDPEGRLVLGEPLAILGREVDRVLRRDERPARPTRTLPSSSSFASLRAISTGCTDTRTTRPTVPSTTCSMPLSMLRRKPMLGARARSRAAHACVSAGRHAQGQEDSSGRDGGERCAARPRGRPRALRARSPARPARGEPDRRARLRGRRATPTTRAARPSRRRPRPAACAHERGPGAVHERAEHGGDASSVPAYVAALA